MNQYRITLAPLTPIIFHWDNMNFSEKVTAWRKAPENKELSAKGDDRSPAWTWLGYLYHNTKVVGIPADNLMTCLREGGAKVLTGKSRETYKKLTQSGILIDQEQWDLLVNDKPVPVAEFQPLIGENDFQKHLEVVEKHDFELLVKRVKVGQAKHVRVRPFFRNWRAVGTLTVIDAEVSGITQKTLQTILNQAGALCGLGDWRPSSPSKSGTFGKFAPTIEKIG